MLNTLTEAAWKNSRYLQIFLAINVFPLAGSPTKISTSLSEGVLYLLVLGATSNRTGLSRGDDAPGGSWGTGLSTMVLRCCTGELSLMLDCESCRERADMAFALLLLRLQFSSGARTEVERRLCTVILLLRKAKRHKIHPARLESRYKIGASGP